MPAELVPVAILTVVNAVLLASILRGARPAPTPVPVRVDRRPRQR